MKRQVVFFASSLYSVERGRGGIAALLYQLVPELVHKYDVKVVVLFGEKEPSAPIKATVIQDKYSHQSDFSLIQKVKFWVITSFFLVRYIVNNFDNIKRAKIISTSPGPSFILPLFFKNVLIWENVSFFAKRNFLDHLRLFVCYIRKSLLIVPTKQEYESLKNRPLTPTVKYLPDWSDPSIKAKPRLKNINKIKFMSAGMLEHRKGFDLLLKAIKLIPDSTRTDFDFTIFGDGGQRGELEHMISSLGLDRCVTLAGFAPDLTPHYNSYDAFILSSRYEGFPLVMVNALASGMPVIAFDCETGPRDIVVSGFNGVLVGNGEVQKMSEAIISFSSSFCDMDYYKNCITPSSKYSLVNSLIYWDELLCN